MEGTKRDLYSIFEGIKEKYLECEKEINQNISELDTTSVKKADFSDQIKIITQQQKTAQNKFTIASIGEFKAGKSTTINTVLGLKSDDGLSCQFEPDTAKAIRILKKDENQTWDAEIIFYEETGFSNEKLTWNEAKKYTSQVELNSNPSLKKKAEAIDEVRYYINNDILDECNFLDLPGTGFDPKHNRVTEAKINECDAVFWILSNTEDPNKETIKNLQMIKHKIIPIINIWYNPETEEEVGTLSFEEIKDILVDNFKAYLGDNEILKYNAKAVEKIQATDGVYPDEDLWGYNAIIERLDQLVYGEGLDLESEKKQRMVDNTLESCAYMDQKIESIVSEVKKYSNQLNNNKIEQKVVKKKIDNAYNSNQSELKGLASNAVDDIISRMNEASELFIDDKMATPKIGMAIRTLTKKGKKKLAEEYEEEYKKKYLEISDWKSSDTWVSALVNDYRENLSTLLISEYSNADIEQDDMDEKKQSNVNLDLNFFSAIGENMSIAFAQQIKENLPIIISGILIYIPGHEIVDILFMLSSLTGKTIGKKQDKLQKRVEQTKRRARLSISFQRTKLVDNFKKIGKEYNEGYKKELLARLEIKKNHIEDLAEAVNKIYITQDEIDLYMKECKQEFSVMKGGI